MLILTHEGSDTASWDMGCIQERFYPLHPMLLYGRAAAMEPSIPVKQVVWYGWRECKDFPSNPVFRWEQSAELVATLVQEVMPF